MHCTGVDLYSVWNLNWHTNWMSKLMCVSLLRLRIVICNLLTLNSNVVQTFICLSKEGRGSQAAKSVWDRSRNINSKKCTDTNNTHDCYWCGLSHYGNVWCPSATTALVAASTKFLQFAHYGTTVMSKWFQCCQGSRQFYFIILVSDTINMEKVLSTIKVTLEFCSLCLCQQ